MNTRQRIIRPYACIPFGPLHRSQILYRANRFQVEVQLDNLETSTHLGNPGRLEELLQPQHTAWLSPAQNPARKTAYDLTLIQHNTTLISVNAQLPNLLVERALQARRIEGLKQYSEIRREVRFGESRLDFCVVDPSGRRCWLEVKSVTSVENGTARFPDAPTTRGCRHLRELISAKRGGDCAMALFIIQRDDAHKFAPNDQTDPRFGNTLREAVKIGVEARAIRCSVTRDRICLEAEVPVILDALSS